MDSKIEFERASRLLERVSWPLAIVGVWPKNRTQSGEIIFIIYMIYYTTHLMMEFMDLASILHSLDLIILNLMETGFQSMAMSRILTIRFNKLVTRIISAIEGDLLIENFRDSEEIKIFLSHISIAEKFYRLGSWIGGGTSVLWYFMPLQTYVITRWMNNTEPILITPYRIYTFFDQSPIERKIMVYVYQFPVVYNAVVHVTSYTVMLAFVTNFCGQLSILTKRMMKEKDPHLSSRVFFREHAELHFKVVMRAQWMNDAFHLVLFYELVATTVLIGLIVYKFLLNIHDADPMGILVMANYIIFMTILVYANCFMGEYLNTECAALSAAYYECNWYEMSPSYKRALLICMRTTAVPIQITAGKCYDFSLQNFTQIMKTSMVYVSMLRTVSN